MTATVITIKKKNRARQFLEYFFYSNAFYGVCAVALSIEASLQQLTPLNPWPYYFFVFGATILYYAYPYVQRYKSVDVNPRTNWYRRHFILMRWHQVVLSLVLSFLAGWTVIHYFDVIPFISGEEWVAVLVFPIAGVLYYGIDFVFGKYSLRRNGWLKPFVIGFTWAGVVTVYPLLFHAIVNKLDYQLTWFGFLLFIKNLMFVAVLCIMFDIKDYATDHYNSLRTFVVKIGLRRTLFYILLPLTLLGLVTFVSYALGQHFHFMKILLNTIPFLGLIAAVYALRRRRRLMYYLVVIDGLMLLKAACGSLAMIFF